MGMKGESAVGSRSRFGASRRPKSSCARRACRRTATVGQAPGVRHSGELASSIEGTVDRDCFDVKTMRSHHLPRSSTCRVSSVQAYYTTKNVHTAARTALSSPGDVVYSKSRVGHGGFPGRPDPSTSQGAGDNRGSRAANPVTPSRRILPAVAPSLRYSPRTLRLTCLHGTSGLLLPCSWRAMAIPPLTVRVVRSKD
jgi:hypothetical protein